VSEAEFAEVMNLHATSAMNAFAIYISLVFAFLTAFYVVGAKLSTRQATLITSLFLIWCLAFALVAVAHLQTFDSLALEYVHYIRSPLMLLPWTEFGMIITASGLLIGGYLAFDARKASVA